MADLALSLPFRVPTHGSLMFCNPAKSLQAKIKLDDHIYSCILEDIEKSCPVTEFTGLAPSGCIRDLLSCKGDDETSKIYCKNSQLFSNQNVFCNSTTTLNGKSLLGPNTVLNCYFHS